MRFHKFKNDSYCVGCRNRSDRKNRYGDITPKGNKVLFGFCWKSHGKKHTTLSDKTVIAEGLGDFFRTLGIKRLGVSRNLPKNVWENPGQTLENGAKVGTAFASRSPKAALSSILEVINFLSFG